MDKYLATSKGDPPLAEPRKEDWNVFEGDRMETNIMPGWGLVVPGIFYDIWTLIMMENSKKKSDYWGQVDLYIGGSEHAVGHLLYSRFWTKFLFDRGFISIDEPFKKMINQGMILGRSNFVYRIKDTNTFVSFDKRKNYQTTRLHVDINFVENDILDIDSFKNWREEYKNKDFVLNDQGKYICGYEVKNVKIKSVQSPDDLIKDLENTLRL